MSSSVDAFPGFTAQDFVLDGVTIHARVGGEGPPLVLVHGYPQSHMMWRHVAPGLAKRFQVIVPDLRGYGRSSVPPSRDGEGYTKRVMGADILAVMRALGLYREEAFGDNGGHQPQPG